MEINKKEHQISNMFYMGKILSVNKLTVSFIWKYSRLFRCVQYIGLFFSLCNLESACQVIKCDGEILTQIICL